MKVVYQGRLWFLLGDTRDEFVLQSLGSHRRQIRIPLHAEGLIIDPTDVEVEEAREFMSLDAAGETGEEDVS